MKKNLKNSKLQKVFQQVQQAVSSQTNDKLINIQNFEIIEIIKEADDA
jgi:hypothetical protein